MKTKSLKAAHGTAEAAAMAELLDIGQVEWATVMVILDCRVEKDLRGDGSVKNENWIRSMRWRVIVQREVDAPEPGKRKKLGCSDETHDSLEEAMRQTYERLAIKR
jgi:hypothetical protein